MRSPSRVSASPDALRRLAAGHGLAACGAVVFADGNERAAAAITVTVVAIAVSLAGALVAARLVRRAAFAPVGVLVGVTACVLLAVTPRGVITVPIAAVLGTGIGIAVPNVDAVDRRLVAYGTSAGVVELLVAVVVGGRVTALTWAAVVVTAVGVVALLWRGAEADDSRRLARRGVALVAVSVLVAGGLVAWVGANDPTVEWFGRVITHGDRRARQVALTFDDGPDDPYTSEVAAILDEHGVKGTFFEVGKAIETRPDVTRALVADGHLVANHSFHHDYWRWLDPRYPELDRTQQAFENAIGTCPAFFRPPHGQRTPFMLAHVSDRGMHAVTWDVSAQDWSARDGTVVARTIVDRARPGSIILLHDGLDGNVGADRSVLRTALPLIIDGLRAKGLEPVRLDQLLGMPGYLDRC